MVAEHDDQVVGYMIYELNKNHLDLLNIAVAREWQRRGVGTAMVRKLSLKLNPQRRTHLWTVVRETNLDGQLFFRAVGFKATEVVRGAFSDSDEDAYAMRLPVESVESLSVP